MSKITTPFLKYGIAATSLTIAIAVYALARENVPSALSPLHSPHAWLVEHSHLFGSAPSFLYTFAITLLLGVVSSKRGGARLHCMVWIGIAMMLEITQLPGISETLANSTTSVLPQQISGLILPYWTHGVFDPVDLLATLLGGVLAMTLLKYLPLHNQVESNA